MSTKVADVFAALALDLKGYNAGMREAETRGDQLGASLKQKVTLKGLLSDIELGRSKMLVLKDAGSLAGTTLKGLGVGGLTKGLGAAKGLLHDIGKGFAIGVGIGSFETLGRVLSDLVNVIPDLIKRGNDYAHTVAGITYATGASAAEASRLAGTLQYLGTPLGGVQNLLGQMSRNLDTAEPRMKALGVTTRDSNGALLNQVQILENARHAFAAFGDGTVKADQLAREFGRGGLKTLVEYLKLSDEQAKLITDDLQKQGLILNQSQIDLAETSAREGDRFQNALTGLGATLFSVVGPQITAFMSNLTNTIEEHVTEISNAISQAISFILGLVSSLVGASGSLDSFSAGIIRAGTETSPYSAQIAGLSVELAKLKVSHANAGDAATGQRKALQAQITVVDDQIKALKALEAQQDKTYKKALDALNLQLDAQTKLLDAEDKQAARQDRDLALTRSLRDAKVSLFEAQAQLRQDEIDNAKITDPSKRKSTDSDILAIAKAQQGVIDAQKAIGDEATSRAHDDRRTEITAVKDYIASIAKLLADADNKKAALATLKRRQTVLEAERATALSKGEAQKAADISLEIEAVVTTETKAQAEIRNGAKQTELDKRKTLLEAEKAAVKSAVVDETAIRRKALEDQIRDLTKQEVAWAKLSGKERDDIGVVTLALNSPTSGLTKALDEARQHGIDAGNGIREAFKQLVDVLSQVLDFLQKIAAAKATLIGGPGDSNFNRAMDQYNQQHSLTTDERPGHSGGLNGGSAWDKFWAYLTRFKPSSNAAGGWAGLNGPELSWLGEGSGPEFVLNADLASRLDRFLSGSMPAFAGGAGGGGDDPVIVRIPAPWTSNGYIDWIDQQLRYRRR